MTAKRGAFLLILCGLALVGLLVSYETGWNPWVVGSFVVAWFVVRAIQRTMKG